VKLFFADAQMEHTTGGLARGLGQSSLLMAIIGCGVCLALLFAATMPFLVFTPFLMLVGMLSLVLGVASAALGLTGAVMGIFSIFSRQEGSARDGAFGLLCGVGSCAITWYIIVPTVQDFLGSMD
jgi:hypothetical protein